MEEVDAATRKKIDKVQRFAWEQSSFVAPINLDKLSHPMQ